MVLEWLGGFASGVLTCITLLCVTVMSGDIVYFLVSLLRPQYTQAALFNPNHGSSGYTGSVSMKYLSFIWVFVWLAQAPLWWLFILPSQSALLIHEEANLALTLHCKLLKSLGERVKGFPSMNTAVDGDFQANPWILFALRFGIPGMYMLCNSVSGSELWKVLLCFALDLSPIALEIMKQNRPCIPWALMHPRVLADSRYDSDCDEHPHCCICFESLCISVAEIVAARSRNQLRLAASRRASMLNITAARWGKQPDWVATTRCGHDFHHRCLAFAAEVLPRCPTCRAPLHGTGPAISEDVMEMQMVSFLFGLAVGGSMLAAGIICRKIAWI